MEDRVKSEKSAVDKLQSLEVSMKWDNLAQFRAKVYAKLVRKLVDAFGDEVMDIAENIRRESGRYIGRNGVDVIANEKKYAENPEILINEMHEMWHNSPASWGRTCTCAYDKEPEKRRHNLLCLRCTYAIAFREAKEEQIGITWCCWDMGYTESFHPLFCQYMPKHMLKGDGLCWQIRELAKDKEEQQWLNSIEHTGWRSFK